MKSKFWFCIFLILFSGVNNPFISQLYSQQKNEESIGIDYLQQLPSNDYIIGPGDILNIIVSRDYPELSNKAVVDGEGTIYVPKLNRIYVEGLALYELNKLLTEAYKKFVKYPSVEVSIKEYRPIRVLIKGEVQEPGLKVLDGAVNLSSNKQEDTFREINLASDDMPKSRETIDSNYYFPTVDSNYYFPTVFDAIRSSSGITEFSDLTNVEVIRINNLTNGGGKIATTVNLQSSLLQGDKTQNIRIYDGDIIKVKRSNKLNQSVLKDAILSNLNSKFLNVFIYGRVRKPGIVKVSRASVLTDAVDMAGGAKVIKGPLTFIRFNNDGSIDKRKFSFKKNAKRGSYRNPLLRESDLLIIGDNFLTQTNEVLTEVTKPFASFFSVYGLYKAFSD